MKEELAEDVVTAAVTDAASETTAFFGSSFYCAAVAATMAAVMAVVMVAAVSVEITAVLLSYCFCSAADAAVDAAPVANCQAKTQPPLWGLYVYIIGKSFGIPYDIKSPPGGIALRRSGRWLPGQPRRRRRILRAGFFFIMGLSH